MAHQGDGYAAVSGRQATQMVYAQQVVTDPSYATAMQFSHLRPAFSGPEVYHQFQDPSGMGIGRPKEEEMLISRLSVLNTTPSFSSFSFAACLRLHAALPSSASGRCGSHVAPEPLPAPLQDHTIPGMSGAMSLATLPSTVGTSTLTSL